MMNYLQKKKKAMLNAIASQPTPPIPSEYQQVEWIGTSGTQYIDTGIIPTETTRWEVKKQETQTQWGSYSIGAIGNTYLQFLILVQSRESFRFGYKETSYTAQHLMI